MAAVSYLIVSIKPPKFSGFQAIVSVCNSCSYPGNQVWSSFMNYATLSVLTGLPAWGLASVPFSLSLTYHSTLPLCHPVMFLCIHWLWKIPPEPKLEAGTDGLQQTWMPRTHSGNSLAFLGRQRLKNKCSFDISQSMKCWVWAYQLQQGSLSDLDTLPPGSSCQFVVKQNHGKECSFKSWWVLSPHYITFLQNAWSFSGVRSNR